MRNFIVAARELAYEAHGKQVDKVGRPYQEHLAGVANGVRVFGGSEYAIAAAYLHDIVEDTKVTANDLRDAGFPEPVVKAVLAVTKHTGEKQGLYLDRVIEAGEDAMIVKLADLTHNTRRDRLAALEEMKGEHVVRRLREKYLPSIARLMLELNMVMDLEGQKELAKVPVGTAGGGTYGGYNYEANLGANGSQYFSNTSLMAGDWPAGFSVPIKRRATKEGKTAVGGSTYELENGDIVTFIEPMVRVWTLSAWTKKVKGDSEWSPAKEKQEPKPKKDKAKATTPSHSGKPAQSKVRHDIKTGRCRVCQKTHKIDLDGLLASHEQLGVHCGGSGKEPVLGTTKTTISWTDEEPKAKALEKPKPRLVASDKPKTAAVAPGYRPTTLYGMSDDELAELYGSG